MTELQTDLSKKVMLACRILAMEGMTDGVLGHVSARIPGTNEMLIRCRGQNEEGVRYTTIDAIRRVDFDGRGDDLQGGLYQIPLELPIHGEIFKKRPEVGCVIHAHPPAALICGITELELKPIFGPYNLQAMQMAIEGVPIFAHAYLITRPDLAANLIEAMQHKDICLMKGHGITVTGETVEDATIRALSLNTLFQVTLEAAKTGRPPKELPQEDLDMLPAGSKFGPNWPWRYYLRKLQEADK